MRYLLLSLLLATTAFAADTDSDQAGAAAMNFINGYVKASNNRNWDAVKFVNASPLVTKNFKSTNAKLIADGFKQNPEVGLGADPVIDGNDCPERYTVKSAKAKDDTASVVLTGPKDFPAELKLRLVKSDGKWLVDASGMMLK
jgi:hypothetical protein